MLPVGKEAAEWSDAEWEEWARESTKDELRKKTKATVQWLVKQSKLRMPQYLAVWALLFLSGQSAVKGAVLAVKERLGSQWSRVVAGGKAVVLLEVCRLAKAVLEWGQSMRRSLGQVETTSQV